jgi:hypothetical protein
MLAELHHSKGNHQALPGGCQCIIKWWRMCQYQRRSSRRWGKKGSRNGQGLCRLTTGAAAGIVGEIVLRVSVRVPLGVFKM